MKINKMPITMALLVFSWLIAISAISISGYLIIFKFGEVRSLIGGLSILLGGLLLAAVIRMLGDIGQMLFDLKDFLLIDFQKDLKTQLQSISNNCEQINCDLKDINQHIYQIKAFFEQIERRLDLKK
ncbi:hypothetical protein KJA13_02860 [Patescibacteria group bacterium]|nr:hypothetical protein [Patescibacteria group bacterium]